MDSGSAGSSSAETSRGRSAHDRRRDFLREVPGAVPPRHGRGGGELVQVPVRDAHRERAELGARAPCTAYAAIRVESSPPLRKAPTGTSLVRWRATVSPSSSSTSLEDLGLAGRPAWAR